MHKTYFLITAILLVVAAGLVFYFLSGLPVWGLAVLAVGLVFLGLPAAFLFGFWMGKTELRGFLSGFDRSLDRMMTAVDTRDAKKSAAAPQPNILVYPPDTRADLPRITHRAASQEEEDL